MNRPKPTGNRGFLAGERATFGVALAPNKKAILGREFTCRRASGCCPQASPRSPRPLMRRTISHHRHRQRHRECRGPDRRQQRARHRHHRPGPPPDPPGRSARGDRGRRRAAAEQRRQRHPPAEPARAVAARLLDRHRGERLGPYPRHRHGRRQSRPRKLGRGVHRRRLPLAQRHRPQRARRGRADRGAARPAGHLVRPQRLGRPHPHHHPPAGIRRVRRLWPS